MKNSTRMFFAISAVLFTLQNVGYSYFDIETEFTKSSREDIKQKNKIESSVFAPLLRLGNGVLFTDVRGSIQTAKEKTNKSVSAGFGGRYNFENFGVFGAYTFYDYHSSYNGNEFSQVTFGAEALSGQFEARVNSYMPIGKHEQIIDKQQPDAKKEIALKGFDGEIGYNIGDTGISVYGGGYYFHRDDNVVKGPRVRAKFSKILSDFAVLNLLWSFQTDKKKDINLI